MDGVLYTPVYVCQRLDSEMLWRQRGVSRFRSHT